MPLKLDMDKLKDLKGLTPDSKLAEAPSGIKIGFEDSFEIGEGDLTLAVEPEAEFEINFFSKAGQEDSDGILGEPKDTSEPSTQVKPQIRFQDGQAWTKYRASVGLQAGAETSSGAAALGLEAGKAFSFLDYRRHSPEQKIIDALLSDLADPRFALNLEDVLELKPGDALAYRVEGKLGGQFGLKWGEVFNANVHGLSSFAEASGLLSFAIPVNASANFEFSVEDEFLIVFSRDEVNSSRIRVAVRKADRTSLGAGAGLSIGIKFADPRLVEQSILGVLLSGKIGESVATIDEVLNKASLADLNELQLGVVRAAFKAVGLDSAFESIQQARERWEELKAHFTKAVKTVAKFKAELGITYTYLRVSTQSSLLQVLLTEGQLSRFHRDLMGRNVSPIVDEIRQGQSDIQLEEYLLEDKVERTQTLGFSLGIGPWKASSKDTLKETEVTQTDFEGRIRMAYGGMRSYVGKEFAGESFSYTVDFNAQMEDFAKADAPTADEFQYGLAIDFLWGESRGLSAKELREALDAAVVWNVIQNRHFEDIENTLEDHIQSGEEGKVRLSLKFEPKSFLALLAPLLKHFDQDEDLIFDCLGRAMPFREAYLHRRNVRARGRLYAPLWKEFCESPDRGISELAGNAASHIDDVESDLAFFEKTPLGGVEGQGNNRTFAMVAHLNGKKTEERWQKFQRGIKILQKAIEGKKSHDEIEKAFDSMVLFWNQPFFVRTLGNYLIRVADEFPHIRSETGRTLTFVFGDKTYVFSGSSEQSS